MKFQVIVHTKGGENHCKSCLSLLEWIGPHFTCAAHITVCAAHITCVAHTDIQANANYNQCGAYNLRDTLGKERDAYNLRGTLGKERGAYSLEPVTCLKPHKIASSSHQFVR